VSGINGEYYDLTADPHELANKFLDPTRQAEVTLLEVFTNILRSCKGPFCAFYEDQLVLPPTP
jgi:hypothetical protein